MKSRRPQRITKRTQLEGRYDELEELSQIAQTSPYDPSLLAGHGKIERAGRGHRRINATVSLLLTIHKSKGLENTSRLCHGHDRRYFPS